jgi:hypothetical protein
MTPDAPLLQDYAKSDAQSAHRGSVRFGIRDSWLWG